jgi:hypothetical protein
MDKGATISTTNIQPDELEDIGEGEHLFHSHMWVKENPLHYIVDDGSKKTRILTKIINRLKLSRMEYLKPYNIGWLIQG